MDVTTLAWVRAAACDGVLVEHRFEASAKWLVGASLPERGRRDHVRHGPVARVAQVNRQDALYPQRDEA
ncbi:MAG: hypothetical protein A2146_02355 [Actinobacteria bacterium RBG_16_67_10]|nr:MAG: hypothetical protein A2146_02355 [Actinobacteria bacterium RBG_16_67_10]